jgi:Ca2+-binding EF-hand superfamily protein
MSILEVIVMSKYLAGGLALAVLFPISTASAAYLGAASPASTATHKRGSFFTSNQNRADVGPRIQKMFGKLDSNRDGFITKNEITALQAQFDERAAKSAPKRAARMFDSLDVDHDGKITQGEAAGSHAKRGRSVFAKADANKDGVVTRAEYEAATASGKIKIRHAGMRGSLIVRLFDGADLDKDGRVSLSETQQAALNEFDSADANHDGVLTPAERRQAAKANRTKRSKS